MANNCLPKMRHEGVLKLLSSFSCLAFVSSVLLVFVDPSFSHHLLYFIFVLVGSLVSLAHSITLFFFAKSSRTKRILVFEGFMTIAFFFYLVLSMIALGLPTAFSPNDDSDILTITFLKYFLLTLSGAGSLVLIRYLMLNLLEKFPSAKPISILAFLSVCFASLCLTVLGILHAIDGVWFLFCLDLGLAILFFIDYCVIKNGNA